MSGGLRRIAWSIAEAGLVWISRLLTGALNATYDLADTCARHARPSAAERIRRDSGEGDPQSPQPP